MIHYEEPWTKTSRCLALAVRADRTAAERAELGSLLAQIGSMEVFEAAHRNKVAPIVAWTLVNEIGIADEEVDWRNVLNENAQRLNRLTAALVEVFLELDKLDCPAAVIENGGVLLASRMPLDVFAAGDFDLLVASTRMDEVRSGFRRLGFREADRRGRPTNRAEFCRESKPDEMIWINAGGAPFDRMWVPLPYTDRSIEWLARRVPAPGMSSLSVLEPSDALVLVAVHTSLHSFVRSPFVRLHADVDWLVRRCTIDWPRVIDEARKVGLSTRVWLSLLMARDILATPVPKSVLNELAPVNQKARALVRLIERDGCFWTGRRKLPGLQSVRLDALLSEDGVKRWVYRVVWPDQQWLSEHFDREGSKGRGRVRLCLKRLLAAGRIWRPE